VYRIVFFGCGFLATWLIPPVLKLALNRMKRISVILIDYEKIEEANLENSLFIYPFAGQYKTTNVMRLLKQAFPNVSITPITMKITRENIRRVPSFDLGICTFDNFESRKIVNDYCVKKVTDLLHVGVGDVNSVAVAWKEYFDKIFKKEPELRVCERIDMIKSGLLATSLTLRALEEYFDKNEKNSYMVTGYKIIRIE